MSKCRNWSIITYLSEAQINQVLDVHETSIKGYAYILHDKDFTDEGKQKEPHYHLLILLHNGNTQVAMQKWFNGFEDDEGVPINSFLQVLEYPKNAFNYLTHNTPLSKDKYQYSVDDIVCPDVSFFLEKEEKLDTLLIALQEMVNGVSLLDIASRYGRDFIVHYGHIRKLYQDIAYQNDLKLFPNE